MYMQSSDALKQTVSNINEFVEERDWNQFHTIKNLVSSISIESAELSETIQWTNPSVEEVLNDRLLLEDIGNEIADVAIYCLRLCSVLDLNLIDLIEMKIESNKQKYPVEKSRGTSKKYTEL